MRSLSAWKRSEITIDATHPGLAKSLDKELRAVDYFQGKAARPPNPWRIIVGYGKVDKILQHGSEEVSRKIEVLSVDLDLTAFQVGDFTYERGSYSRTSS